MVLTAGKVIIEEGAPGDFMYFLSRGEVNVYTNFGVCLSTCTFRWTRCPDPNFLLQLGAVHD